jgi:hypothetical protein
MISAPGNQLHDPVVRAMRENSDVCRKAKPSRPTKRLRLNHSENQQIDAFFFPCRFACRHHSVFTKKSFIFTDRICRASPIG